MFFYGNVIFVFLLKILWGRIRFRDLSQDYSDFTAWYIPNGITGDQSFPSGHAAMGFVLISLFVLVMDKSLYRRIVFKGLILSCAILICISRIIIGAHYVSDVLFGSFIMIVTYLLVMNRSNKLAKVD